MAAATCHDCAMTAVAGARETLFEQLLVACLEDEEASDEGCCQVRHRPCEGACQVAEGVREVAPLASSLFRILG